MSLRVTFDTNALDLACRPEQFQKDPRQPQLLRVRDALVSKEIQGFYPVSMLTIEGVKKKDRAKVIAGTRIRQQPEEHAIVANAELPAEVRAFVGEGDLSVITQRLVVEEPDRQPLPDAFADRVRAAHGLGLLALKAVPRLGAFTITDRSGSHYLANGEGAEFSAWIDMVHKVSRAIESRGLGYAQVKALGQALKVGDPGEIWYRALVSAKDIHQQRAVERAFSEWADGDAIASHIAYGLDVFCSNDLGKSNAADSVLSSASRGWLTQEYGIRFMTFDELLQHLS